MKPSEMILLYLSYGIAVITIALFVWLVVRIIGENDKEKGKD